MTALRLAVLAIGLASLAAGVAALVRLPRLWPVGADLTAFGLLLVVTTIVERGRYGRATAGRASGFEATGERFVDPVSGTEVAVDYNPSTGERRYRAP